MNRHWLLFAFSFTTLAAAAAPQAPAVLPGKGLAEHDFFYAGEAKDERMFIVKKGQIVWALRAWTPPADLGPSTTIQILDGSRTP